MHRTRAESLPHVMSPSLGVTVERLARWRGPLLIILAHVILATAVAPGAAMAAETSLDFARDIRSLLSNRCFRCHGPDEAERQGGLRLDLRDAALAAADSGEPAIVPGRPRESQLLSRVTAADDGERMPPVDAGPALSAEEIAVLTQWIADGAPYAAHWAYVPATRPSPPTDRQLAEIAARHQREFGPSLRDWPRNSIDRFLLARQLPAGFTPRPEADRRTLARRVALDVTGLPPTPAELATFLHDTLPGAYERFVDRMLDSPAYGEHWARQWLDLARYTDSAGYADDPPRTIWGYRDYVIRSYNANKPFDEFTREQLAGDLLPNPTTDQLVATAFHRNTQTNNEGGTNDEEYRNVAIVDRVNTTLAVWMGTTMACAQCHSHKYDPITQHDYFRFFAIFNNTADADRRDESPVVEIWSDRSLERRAELESQLAPTERPERASPDVIAALREELAALQPITTVPVFRELPPHERRETHIQHRGNFMSLGDAVPPGLPRGLFGASPFQDPPTRLDVANWLVDESNPLTARVLANRYWETLFGRGIVKSSEEFGSQGDLPTHPELLDWLATELHRTDWNIKSFVKLLVTSAAYRQDSRLSGNAWELDPDNTLLARGPRLRLTAEMVRDQALAVSGLLSRKQYGAPVRPLQPSLGVNAAFGGGIDWTTSEGEDQYRRAIYTTWRRSNPYPSLSAFDAPSREVCTIRRDPTNTPLQALVTLNDPVYLEAAQSLAQRTMSVATTPKERVDWAFEQCLCRLPTSQETQSLVELYDRARHHFEEHPAAAQELVDSDRWTDESTNEVASWTVVGNVLMNLDEFLMKR